MKIRLNEIPADGRAYKFNRESGELNASLEDLIEEHAYDVDLYIKPIGNAYEMRGSLKTMISEVCSRCGWDVELPIEKNVNEILFEEGEDHRKSHSVHGNQSVDFLGQGPSMTPVKGDVFDAGDYVHEAIALAQPFYPTCGVDECEHIDEVRKVQQELAQEFASADVPEKANPFAVLKGLSLETEKKN